MTIETNGNEFRILGDTFQQFRAIDAIAQFNYKEYEISMSTAGRSRGACANMVAVFLRQSNTFLAEFYTVEQAIDWINSQN